MGSIFMRVWLHGAAIIGRFQDGLDRTNCDSFDLQIKGASHIIIGLNGCADNVAAVAAILASRLLYLWATCKQLQY